MSLSRWFRPVLVSSLEHRVKCGHVLSVPWLRGVCVSQLLAEDLLWCHWIVHGPYVYLTHVSYLLLSVSNVAVVLKYVQDPFAL